MQDTKKDISNLSDKLTPDSIKKVVSVEEISGSIEEISGSIEKKIEEIIIVDKNLTIRTVETATMNPMLGKLIADLTKDPLFLSRVDESVKKILQDGKINLSDIPEIVFLIMDAYNTVGKVRINKDDLIDFVKLVFEFVVNKYNLPKDKMVEYELLIVSSVKLLLLTPKINAAFVGLSKYFKCCK